MMYIQMCRGFTCISSTTKNTTEISEEYLQRKNIQKTMPFSLSQTTTIIIFHIKYHVGEGA